VYFLLSLIFFFNLGGSRCTVCPRRRRRPENGEMKENGTGLKQKEDKKNICIQCAKSDVKTI
jgi:hypothetical protein